MAAQFPFPQSIPKKANFVKKKKPIELGVNVKWWGNCTNRTLFTEIWKSRKFLFTFVLLHCCDIKINKKDWRQTFESIPKFQEILVIIKIMYQYMICMSQQQQEQALGFLTTSHLLGLLSLSYCCSHFYQELDHLPLSVGHQRFLVVQEHSWKHLDRSKSQFSRARCHRTWEKEA